MGRSTRHGRLKQRRISHFFSYDEQAMIRTITAASVGFVLAHEVAHHVLGDLEKTDRSIEQLREAETRADNWALDVFRANGLFAYNAVHVFDYLFGMEGVVLSKHELDTHPRPAERILNILKIERGFIKSGSWKESEKQSILKRVDHEIECAQKALNAEKAKKGTPAK